MRASGSDDKASIAPPIIFSLEEALDWEGDGFLLLYKRLLDGRYQWPRTKQEVMEMTQEQFEWLMSGQTIVPTIRKTKPKSMA